MIAYRSLFAMGTRLEMVLPGVNNEIADTLFTVIRDQLKYYEKLLSIYIDDSEFSKINSHAENIPWKTTQDCFNLISSLITYHDITMRCFDPTLGLIKNDMYSSNKEKIRNLLKIDIHDRITLDFENYTVSFNVAGVRLDSGAFGKGYALDSIKKILLSHNIKDAFISFGDSSVMTLGKHPEGDFWKIGIRDLKDENVNAWIFEMNDGSVSTSGNTEQNRKKTDGKHIFNPLTAVFERLHSVVSVNGPSAFEAEILSTALFVADTEIRKKIMTNFPQYRAVEIVSSKDGNETITTEIN